MNEEPKYYNRCVIQERQLIEKNFPISIIMSDETKENIDQWKKDKCLNNHNCNWCNHFIKNTCPLYYIKNSTMIPKLYKLTLKPGGKTWLITGMNNKQIFNGKFLKPLFPNTYFLCSGIYMYNQSCKKTKYNYIQVNQGKAKKITFDQAKKIAKMLNSNITKVKISKKYEINKWATIEVWHCCKKCETLGYVKKGHFHCYTEGLSLQKNWKIIKRFLDINNHWRATLRKRAVPIQVSKKWKKNGNLKLAPWT